MTDRRIKPIIPPARSTSGPGKNDHDGPRHNDSAQRRAQGANSGLGATFPKGAVLPATDRLKGKQTGEYEARVGLPKV